MTKLYIVRGNPGSGKSTYAKSLMQHIKNSVHYEADMYFMYNGEYIFDKTKLGAAHEWCLMSTQKSLQEGKNVIVSNTFTTLRELQPYIDFCNKNGFEFLVIRMNNDFGNIHNVPEDVIQNMKKRFQDYLGETIISNPRK